MRIFLLVLCLVAIAAGAAFSYYNPAPVTVDWLAGTSEIPLGVLLLAAMLAGFLLAMLLLGPTWWILRLRLRRLQKSLLRQSGELDSLRALKPSAGTLED